MMSRMSSTGPATAERAPRAAAPFGAVLLVALLAKLLVIGAAVWADDAEPSDSPYLAAREGDANDVVWLLARGFDANMYQRVAVEGVGYDEFSTAFPPGYPMLVRAVHAVVGNAQTAAVLVSNACGVGAVVLFTALATAYTRRRRTRGDLECDVDADDGAVLRASVLFALTPGVLAFGTVAYSESAFLLLAVGAWWAYLSAERDDDPAAPRSFPRLALASVLAGASVLVRHAGAVLFVAWALLELRRVLRAGARGRALLESAALGWAGVPTAAWILRAFAEHDLAAVQQRLWDMRFVLFGGPWSLAVGSDARPALSPEFVVLVYMSLPLVLWLGLAARRLDARLGLVALIGLVLALSVTGAAAQAFNRYAWSLWPLALGALAVRDRGAVWAAAGGLLLLSTWCVLGHVQGSMAL